MIHESMIVHYNRKAAVSEAYRTLRTNILFSKGANFPKVLVITSTQPNEGKTVTSCNLGLAFAQSGHKTIIIDADLRRPTIHQMFGLSRLHGFSTLLEQKSTIEEAIQHIDECNIDIITSGPTAEDPTELLSSKALGSIVDDLKQQYDIIIIDTPPVGMVTDASILTTVSTGVILVLKEGTVHGRQFARVKEQLERVGGKILGTVFNMVGNPSSGSNKYYTYYYNYYYYRYGYYYSDENEGNKPKKKGIIGRLSKHKNKKKEKSI